MNCSTSLISKNNIIILIKISTRWDTSGQTARSLHKSRAKKNNKKINKKPSYSRQ